MDPALRLCENQVSFKPALIHTLNKCFFWDAFGRVIVFSERIFCGNVWGYRKDEGYGVGGGYL